MSCFRVDVVERVGSGTESSRSGREAEKRMVRSRSSASPSGRAKLMVGVRNESHSSRESGQPTYVCSSI